MGGGGFDDRKGCHFLKVAVILGCICSTRIEWPAETNPPLRSYESSEARRNGKDVVDAGTFGYRIGFVVAALDG
jgi:hypothetical protein